MNTVYKIGVSNNACNFELFINDIRIYKHSDDLPLNFDLPVNQYLRSGLNEITARLLPISNEEVLSYETKIEISIYMGLNENETFTGVKTLSTFNTDELYDLQKSGGRLPVYLLKGELELTIPFSNKIFTDLAQINLDYQAVVQYFQELHRDFAERNLNSILSKMSFKFDVYSAAYEKTIESERARIRYYLDLLGKMKLQPFTLDGFKPQWIKDGFICCLEDLAGDQIICFEDVDDENALLYFPVYLGMPRGSNMLSIVL